MRFAMGFRFLGAGFGAAFRSTARLVAAFRLADAPFAEAVFFTAFRFDAGAFFVGMGKGMGPSRGTDQPRAWFAKRASPHLDLSRTTT
ncbi:MAG: hypothetical protein JST66_08725 [Bacteroidetes bacterium]|nr:hypothetical protein [Bacteroidota bacterium]